MENEEKKEQEIQEEQTNPAVESSGEDPASAKETNVSEVEKESSTETAESGDQTQEDGVEAGEEESTEEEDLVITATGGEVYDPNSDLQWYFIQVLSGNEEKISKILNEIVKTRGLDPEIPNVMVPKVEKLEKTKSGEKKLVLKKLYPGYVLLRMKMSDDNWNLVRNINNVIDFVGGKYNPNPISRQEWEEIFMGKKKQRKEEIKIKFSLNEKVKITDGPFANFFGDIAEINEEKKHVKVMISIFGRLTPVELSYDEVEKI